MELKEFVLKKKNESFSERDYGENSYQVRLCVLDVDGLRENNMEKAHGSWYSIHPVANKMFSALKNIYW